MYYKLFGVHMDNNIDHNVICSRYLYKLKLVRTLERMYQSLQILLFPPSSKSYLDLVQQWYLKLLHLVPVDFHFLFTTDYNLEMRHNLQQSLYDHYSVQFWCYQALKSYTVGTCLCIWENFDNFDNDVIFLFQMLQSDWLRADIYMYMYLKEYSCNNT